MSTMDVVIPAASTREFEMTVNVPTAIITTPHLLQFYFIELAARDEQTGLPEPVWYDGEGGLFGLNDPIRSAIFKIIP